jgi:hypothetical protein
MGQMRMAAYALAVTLTLSAFALAQRDRDDDDYDRGRYPNAASTEQYGYQNGYRDGVQKGRHEGRENDPRDFRSREWRDARNGYQSWMGPLDAFRHGYREGYSAGFQTGFREGRDQSRNDGFYQGAPAYSAVPTNWGWGRNNTGYSVGYQDGRDIAREDRERGKPFNSNPRGKYDHRDHGYTREYGDKSAYRAQYSDGYRAGYEANFGYR